MRGEVRAFTGKGAGKDLGSTFSSPKSAHLAISDAATLSFSQQIISKRAKRYGRCIKCIQYRDSLLGLCAGVLCAVAVDAFDQSVESPLDIERRLKVRSLGAVPDGTIASKSGGLLQKDTLEFVAYDNPRTLIADAIRCVHTSLVFSHPDDTVRRIVVSSALPGEGKTTVAVWLSTILHSGNDKRTLLMDCDFRRPRLHEVFGHKETDPGLTSLFNGSCRDSTEVIRAHRIPGLFYITSGSIPNDPVGLLHSARMEHLIEELGRMFDYLVIDTPPVLGHADALGLSRWTDGLLLVVRQGKVRMEELTEAVNAINSMERGRLLGIVLNKTRLRSGGYGYGGYYYSRYST